jgi:hypothetical protein
MDYSTSGKGQVADSCAHGNEPSGSIKCGEFLNYMEIFFMVAPCINDKTRHAILVKHWLWLPDDGFM